MNGFALRGAAAALCATVLLHGASALAQDANANAQKNAMAKAQFMLKQATAEKAELQQQATALQQQVDKLTRELAATQTDASAGKQKMQAAFNDTIEQWRQRDAKQTGQLEELRAHLKAQAEQSAALAEKLQAQTGNFNVCYGNNKQLLELNREILARYENKGVFDALRQQEPFTGLKQVEVENLVQDYRYKLDDLTVDAPAGPQ
jgi:septal ring factor EnvC (AmiA/AmiB activator)